jgi:hypothetical protein
MEFLSDYWYLWFIGLFACVACSYITLRFLNERILNDLETEGIRTREDRVEEVGHLIMSYSNACAIIFFILLLTAAAQEFISK